ncbi:MAG: DUF389 domain-containing protein [Actinomycetota bacterium]
MTTNQTAFGAITTAVRRWTPDPPSPDAQAAIEELVPDEDLGPYLGRFSILVVLSASIAAFGLLADSAAVVIGAMLVAPMMTPITAAAAAVVMAMGKRLIRALLVIVVGTVAAIAVGWLTSFVAGAEVTAVNDLPGEVTSRTFPGLLDLGVAISAGAAAGYILPRRSATSALPGVGIAVALVPPLGAVGITLEVGARDLAANALLLYLTNLAAIIFAASLMLLFSGFRPANRQGRNAVTGGLIFTLAAVIAVAVPLTLHTQSAIRDVSLQRSVSSAVVAWDDTVRIVEMNADIVGGRADVELLLSGPNAPQPAWRLAREIDSRFRGAVDLRLFYQRDELFEVSVR